MKRIIVCALRSCAGTRSLTHSCPIFNAPANKYLEIYNGDFEKQSFPINLLGGSHITFSKILFKFAEQAEGSNFDLYLKDFESLSQIAAKLGPFWTEAEFMNDDRFSSLSPGFRFTLAWMQSERMLDSLNQVKASYQELADSFTKQVRAVITVPWDPSSRRDEMDKIEAEAKALFNERNQGSNIQVIFQHQMNMHLKDGYTYEIDNLFVNKSAAARAASSTIASKDQQKDWTAMPALPVKPIAKESPLLLKLIGADLDQLADIDEVERRCGV
jgi:hypothetical protein